MRSKLFGSGLIGAAVIVMCVCTSAQAALVHDYEFSDPSAAIDSVGASNGTLQGGATISGGALHLNGSSAYVSFADYLVPTGASPYSVAISVNTPILSNLFGFAEIISQGVSGGPGFFIGSASGTQYRLTDYFQNTGVPFAPGQNDLLFSSGAAGSQFYVNGVLAFSSPTQAAIGAGATPTSFGKQFAPYGEYFAGDIDSIRIYDSAIGPGSMSPVPLPAAAPMFGAALLGLAGLGYAAKGRAKIAA